MFLGLLSLKEIFKKRAHLVKFFHSNLVAFSVPISQNYAKFVNLIVKLSFLQVDSGICTHLLWPAYSVLEFGMELVHDHQTRAPFTHFITHQVFMKQLQRVFLVLLTIIFLVNNRTKCKSLGGRLLMLHSCCRFLRSGSGFNRG